MHRTTRPALGSPVATLGVALTLAGPLAAAWGCSGSTAPGASSPTSPADPDTCAGHARTGPCMNDDAFAQCRAREAECAGRVLVLESCPLQFACP